jgi:hypothetical protein
MAVPRYYRVLRGQRTAAARTKYLDYLSGLATPDKQDLTPTNRPEKKVLYITPFNISLGATVVLQASAYTDSYTKLSTGIGAARLLTAIPETNTAVKLRSAKPARVSATQRTAGVAGVYKQSKATGLWYIDYGGKSYSCPFGRGASVEKEGDAFETIKAELTQTFKSVHLIEEQI